MKYFMLCTVCICNFYFEINAYYIRVNHDGDKNNFIMDKNKLIPTKAIIDAVGGNNSWPRGVVKDGA
jgi:hypothetical protein